MTAKILIVDDESAVCESLEELLRMENFQAESAGSGEDALKVLSEVKFDLVLLDIKMPGIDGVEVMRQIKKYHPDTRIIIITGYGSLDSAIKSIRSGAQDYM